MKVSPISNTSIQKLYPVSFYNRLEKLPIVEKIEGDIKNYSKQIQDFDLFKYYASKGIIYNYKKGIYLDRYF